MGWQDRDWAKWTESERELYLRGTSRIVPGAFVAVVVSLVGSLAFAHFHGFRLPHVHSRATYVYGAGFERSNDGEGRTCTRMARDGSGVVQCTGWLVVFPGQQVATAVPLPPGTSCNSAEVDQRNGRWVCTTPSST